MTTSEKLEQLKKLMERLLRQEKHNESKKLSKEQKIINSYKKQNEKEKKERISVKI